MDFFLLITLHVCIPIPRRHNHTEVYRLQEFEAEKELLEAATNGDIDGLEYLLRNSSGLNVDCRVCLALRDAEFNSGGHTQQMYRFTMG